MPSGNGTHMGPFLTDTVLEPLPDTGVFSPEVYHHAVYAVHQKIEVLGRLIFIHQSPTRNHSNGSIPLKLYLCQFTLLLAFRVSIH